MNPSFEIGEDDDDYEGTTTLQRLFDLQARLFILIDRANYYGEHVESLKIFVNIKADLDRIVDVEETRILVG